MSHRTIGQILADENIGLPLTRWETERLRRYRRRESATPAAIMRGIAGASMAGVAR